MKHNVSFIGGGRMLLPVIFILSLLSCEDAMAGSHRYRDSKEFSSDDFLFKENGGSRDRMFTDYNIVDASLDLGVSTGGCGQINVAHTLRANLRNLLNEKTFQQMGSDLAGSSFMLLTCYMSPQLCSIMKSSRVNSSLLANLNFKTCDAVNKYQDERVSDWELSRQKCFNKALSETGGDADAAAERCGKNSYNYGLADWTGSSNSNVQSNQLLEASGKWLGVKSAESRRVLDLTKALVGDSVIARGEVSVDFGSRKRNLSPRDYYYEQRRGIEEKFTNIFKKMGGGLDTQQISEAEFDDLNTGSERKVITRSTLENLSRLPGRKRRAATEKLSSKIALARVATDVSKSIDMLSAMEKNPNLPLKRKKEIREKRRTLKESIQTTVFLEHQKNEPVNKVLSQLSREGEKYRQKSFSRSLEIRANQENQKSMDSSLFNCADGFMCLR